MPRGALDVMEYEHTQKGGLHWLLFATAVVCALGGTLVLARGEHDAWAAWLLYGVGVLIAALASCFASLTIRGEEGGLRVRFGPVGLFRTYVPYARITSAEPGRTRLIDGLGVHWVPGRGWTWNLWGFDCVVLQVDGKPMRIGTNDAEALAAFVQSRIGSASQES